MWPGQASSRLGLLCSGRLRAGGEPIQSYYMRSRGGVWSGQAGREGLNIGGGGREGQSLQPILTRIFLRVDEITTTTTSTQLRAIPVL